MNRFLASLAVALGHLLGLVRPLACAGPVLPVAVPLVAGAPAWFPLRPLGLPGDYTPIVGGEP